MGSYGKIIICLELTIHSLAVHMVVKIGSMFLLPKSDFNKNAYTKFLIKFIITIIIVNKLYLFAFWTWYFT